MEIDETLERLRDKFDRIRELDREFRVHGASSHRHEFQPATPGELEELEAVLGCALPEQYRSFVRHIGHGAGPSYGLFPVPAIIEAHREAQYISKAVASKDKKDNDLWNVSELTQEFWDRQVEKRRQSNDPTYFTAASYDHTLSLCDHGCGWTTELILAGPYAGHVIDDVSVIDGDEIEGDWLAAFDAPSPEWNETLPTFFEWIEWWADKALKQATAYQARR